jgi:hypothetical protein
MKQIYVKVRDISVDDNQKPTITNGTESVLTYNAFKILAEANPPRYVLFYQCDENGKQIAGDPNLNAQHKALIARKDVEAVGNAGPSESEKLLQDEITRLRLQLEQAQKAQASVTPVVEATSVKETPVSNPEEPVRRRSRKPQTVEA